MIVLSFQRTRRPAMRTVQPCPRCSKRIPSDAQFCRRCGLALSARTAGPAALRPPPVRDPSGARNRAALYSGRGTTTTRSRQPGSRGWLALLVLIGLVLAAHSLWFTPSSVENAVKFPALDRPSFLPPPAFNPQNGPGVPVPPTYSPQHPLMPPVPTFPSAPFSPYVHYRPNLPSPNDPWGKPVGEPDHEDRAGRGSREHDGR